LNRIFVLRVFGDHAAWFELRDGERSTDLREDLPENANIEVAIERLEAKARAKWPGLVTRSVSRQRSRKPQTGSSRPGFSLVELVIVIVIIGIIAAVAIPRLSRASEAAGGAALRADLAILRDAIDLYAAEHNGNRPGRLGNPTGFWNRLTQQTDASGKLNPASGQPLCGPYLLDRVEVPVGPNAGVNGVLMTTTSPASAAVDETETLKGWVYNYETGELIANTDDLDRSGVGYDNY
jgi:prepilin-type N-terminal cleavage/methylation domain-containing protein